MREALVHLARVIAGGPLPHELLGRISCARQLVRREQLWSRPLAHCCRAVCFPCLAFILRTLATYHIRGGANELRAGCVAGKAVRCHISGSLCIGLAVTPAGRRIPLLGARTGPRRNASCCRGTLSLSLSTLHSYLCHTFCSLFIGLPVTPAGRRIPLLGARTGPRRNASCCRGTLSLSLSTLHSYLCHTFCSLFIGLPVTPPTPTPLPPSSPLPLHFTFPTSVTLSALSL